MSEDGFTAGVEYARDTLVTITGFVRDWPEDKPDALIGFTVGCQPDQTSATTAARISKQAIVGSRSEQTRLEWLEQENRRLIYAAEKSEAALEQVLRGLPKADDAQALISILEDTLWWFKGFSAASKRSRRHDVPALGTLRNALDFARRIKALAERVK